jgi:hypothetical protein
MVRNQVWQGVITLTRHSAEKKDARSCAYASIFSRVRWLETRFGIGVITLTRHSAEKKDAKTMSEYQRLRLRGVSSLRSGESIASEMQLASTMIRLNHSYSLLATSRKSARRSRLVGGRKPSDLRKEVKGFRVLGFVVIFAGEQEKKRVPEPAGGRQETERPEKGG